MPITCMNKPDRMSWFLILNTREGPFADVRVRQAANYAVNKAALVEEVLEGTAEGGCRSDTAGLCLGL